MNKHLRFLLVVILWHSAPVAADEVKFTNGDRLTGNFVRSDARTLTLKSVVAGEVTVPWNKVEEVTIGEPFHVTVKGGRVLSGSLHISAAQVEVRTATGEVVTVPLAEVEAIRSEAGEQAYRKEQARLDNPGWRDFWSGSADAGISAARGNAETLTLSTGARAARTTVNDRLSTRFTLLFAENNTTGVSVRTANAVRGGVRYERNLNDRIFAFGFTDLEFDEFKELDLRTVFGGGVGWRVWRTNRLSLAVFSGASFNREIFSTGVTRKTGEGLVGQEIRFQLSSRTELRGRAVAYPNLSNLGTYRFTFDGSVVTKLNNWLSWQVTVSDRFLSDPVAGTQRNDMLLTTGLRFSLGKEAGGRFRVQVPKVIQ